MLGRSPEAVKTKSQIIGFKKTNRPVPWTKKEDMLLKKLYRNSNAIDISKRIGRSISAIPYRARLLGLTTPPRIWSKKELNLLRRLYPSKTAQEVADKINRSLGAVRQRIVILGLRKRKPKA